jgi:hypothetical protein
MEFTPLNISLFTITPQTLERLRPVTVPDVYDGMSRSFHPNGLFSTQTFGLPGWESRYNVFSYIRLNIPVFSPHYFITLCACSSLYDGIMSGEKYAIWNKELSDFEEAKDLEGETGFSFFVKNFKNLKIARTGSVARDEEIAVIEKFKDKALIANFPVIPAGYRDYEIGEDGKPSEDEINGMYRRVLGKANMLTTTVTADTAYLLDRTRYMMQKDIAAIYEYIYELISGKHKAALGKFAARAVMHGSSNIITSRVQVEDSLHSGAAPGSEHTTQGLYQYMKSSLPKVLHDLKVGYLASIFSRVEEPVGLVDPKTLLSVSTVVSAESFDKYTTAAGLESLINRFRFPEYRDEAVMVDGKYLALLYNSGSDFMVVGGKDKLPEGLDHKNLSPITLAELLYISTYKGAQTSFTTNTRYPIIERGSIYISRIWLSTTTAPLKLYQLGEDGKRNDDVANSFPVRGGAYSTSVTVANSHIKRLQADFDGDSTQNMPIMSEEGIEEAKKIDLEVSAHVSPIGELYHPLGSDISELVVKHLTSTPVRSE